MRSARLFSSGARHYWFFAIAFSCSLAGCAGDHLRAVPGAPQQQNTVEGLTGNTTSALTLRGLVEYAIPTPNSQPEAITLGPDGNVWFVESNAQKIGRITPLGKITEFRVPEPAQSITAGPDGNLWFTTGEKVGRITPSGAITLYVPPSLAPPFPTHVSPAITAGPDGALWSEGNASRIDRVDAHWGIIRITTKGRFSVVHVQTGFRYLFSLVTGPDGALWFTQENPDSGFGRITTSGLYTFYPHANGYNDQPFGITRARGALWFTDSESSNGVTGNPAVGRLTTAGIVAAEYTIPTRGSFSPSIALGPDGNLWFTDYVSSGVPNSKIGRMTLSGSIVEFSLAPNRIPYGVAEGPAGTMWFTEYGANKIAKFIP